MKRSLVYNPTADEIKVQAYGNWFNFKSGQYKEVDADIAHFLTIDKAYLGLVGLPDFIIEEDPNRMDEMPSDDIVQDYRERKQAAILEAKKLGIERRVTYLKSIVTNLEVSLKRDLEQKNLKVDPHTMASKGELSAYRELAKYSQASQDDAAKQVEELKKLKEQIANGA